MKENYKITVKSESFDGNLEVSYFGNYVNKGKIKYIIYKEYEGVNPQNYIFCIIKVENDNLVTLTKNKKYQSKIILEKGVRHYSPYYTEYGLITMSVYTSSIENNLSDNGGTLNAKYTLSADSNLISALDISIIVEKITKNN